jgi:alpha-amylase
MERLSRRQFLTLAAGAAGALPLVRSELLRPAAALQAPGTPYSATWPEQIVYVMIWEKFFDGQLDNDYMKDEYDLPNPKYQGGFLGGDALGIADKMRYLKSLGATCLLVYPVLYNDTRPLIQYLAGGYRVRDYSRTDPNFGTDLQLTVLVRELHSTLNGPRMNVIMDLPIAMTGLEHPWMTHQRFFPWHYRPWDLTVEENIGSEPMHLEYGDVDNSFGMGIINHTLGMATGSSVYRYLRDDVVFSLVDRFDLDGFRYDSAQDAYAVFWRQLLSDFRDRYGASRPDFMQVGEVAEFGALKSWEVYPYQFMNQTVQDSVGPIMMDGVYDFGLINAIQAVFAGGEDASEIVDSMNISSLFYEHPERMIASVDNYEDPTFLSQVVGGSAKRKLYLAEAFLLTIDRVPFVYTGNEYGIDYSLPGQLFESGDPTFLDAFLRLSKIARIGAFRRGARAWLQTSSTVLAYARSEPSAPVTYVVVLGNAAAEQATTVPLGSNGIRCSRAVNLLRPDDKSFQLIDPGTTAVSLAVRLAPFEPKILLCVP